jgi:hypothetical protein
MTTTEPRVVELSSHNELPTFPIVKRLYTGTLEFALAKYQARYHVLPETVWHIKDTFEFWIGV